MNALRRYRSFLLVLVLGTIVTSFLFNTWVNPWRVTPTPWSSTSFEDYRAIDNQWNRTAKAGLARSGNWKAALFGSSRVDIALDPQHPIFRGKPCANLGLNAANIEENYQIFSYFMENNSPELVIFTIDPGDLTTPMRKRNLTDYSLSPLDPHADPLERELRYHEGISTLAASFDTLGRQLRQETAKHTPQGFRRHAAFPENQRKLIAGLYLATTTRMVHGRIRYGQLNPEKLDLLDNVITQCQQTDCRLIIILTPNHGLFQLSYEELGDPDPFFSLDRKALAERASEHVEVWDFLGPHPINTEALPPAGPHGGHFRYFIDLFHATPEVGSLMLDRIQGKDHDYGTRLTIDNLKQRLQQVRQGLNRYRSEHPADVDFLKQSLKAYQPEP
ncbi:MAG: hypothetical protein ACQKBU_06315 [Verrucomicrobiales bacterium]